MRKLNSTIKEVAAKIVQPVEVSTPFPALDGVTRGLHRKELTILAGRSSMGKTSCMLDLALHTSKTIPTGIFSFEMAESQLIERAIANEQQTSYVALKEGKIAVADKTIESLSQRNLYINDNSGLTPVDMARIVEENNFQIIFVDYLQLIRSFGKGQRYEDVDRITQSLKEIAKQYNISVVCLCQLNRAVEQRENHQPRLSDLRESGGIEQIADTIIFLYRPAYYRLFEKHEDIVDDGEGHLIVAKQRNGPLADIPAVWIAEQMSYKSVNFSLQEF